MDLVLILTRSENPDSQRSKRVYTRMNRDASQPRITVM